MAKNDGDNDSNVSASPGPASPAVSSPTPHLALDRRSFLGGSFGAAAASAAAVVGLPALAGIDEAQAFEIGPLDDFERANVAFHVRVQVAAAERSVAIPPHPSNFDEIVFHDKIGSYTKGLPHDAVRGEVDRRAYSVLIKALSSGQQRALERVPLGCPNPALQLKLVNPLAGLAFDLEGTDSHQLFSPPAPAFCSAEEAGEIVENYWMALLRDVPFAEYATSRLAAEAAADLSALSDFRGPKLSGVVTPQTLFRGTFPGELVGPYISQFRLLDAPLYLNFVEQRILPPVPKVDYVTDFQDWVTIQNGCEPSVSTQFEARRRYILNGRDLGEQVHNDVVFAAYYHYLSAIAVLQNMSAPLNPGNPYLNSRTQEGFGTFGAPHGQTLMAEATTRALKAVWFQKWFVHRRSRPEDFAARVHLNLTGETEYPIHPDVFASSVLAPTFDYNASLNGGSGTFLLSQSYPEGSPLHPAYGSGHACIAGACVTLLKAFYDERFVIPRPVVPDPGSPAVLLPFVGPPLTVGGELNKLASNSAFGRNIAGVHWRSDARQALLLGEAVALSILRDQRPTFVENFEGFTFTKFDGQVITV